MSRPIAVRKSSATVAGAKVGQVAGRAAGSAIGAALGSVVPVVGTAIGGAIGGVVGGAAGTAIGGTVGGAADAGKTGVARKIGQVAVEGAKDKVKPKNMAQTSMEMQQKRAEMQQQKNQAQMSSAQDMADKAKAGANVSKGEYVHPSVEQYIQYMYNDLDGSGRPLKEPNNLTGDYSGVTRQNMENVFTGNRESGYTSVTEPQEIPAQNLPPKIEAEPEPEFDPNAEPSFEGRLPDEFYARPHAQLRLFKDYRINDDKERQEVIDRIHSALSPYLDKDGNYKKDVPTKEFAIRTHLLDSIREAKEIPKDVLRQHGLKPNEGTSVGDSVIAVVKPHERFKNKPQLITVMNRHIPDIAAGQEFIGDQFGKNNTMTLNAHGLKGNEYKEHIARRQAEDGKLSKNKRKQQAAKRQANATKTKDIRHSEPFDLAWQMLFKESVELHHNEELPQEFIDDVMMLDRTHKMTPTNNGTLIEDIDPFMHRTIQLMAENYKEENPTVVEPRNQHLFY